MSYKLTKDQARQVLKVRNKMIDAINGLIECGDIGLREMHDLKNSIEGWGENSLDSIFVFRPPKDSFSSSSCRSSHCSSETFNWRLSLD